MRNRGFTLIELLFVIACVALGALSVVGVIHLKRTHDARETQAQLGSLQPNVVTYMDQKPPTEPKYMAYDIVCSILNPEKKFFVVGVWSANCRWYYKVRDENLNEKDASELEIQLVLVPRKIAVEEKPK